jgi:hypothetical protein
LSCKNTGIVAFAQRFIWDAPEVGFVRFCRIGIFVHCNTFGTAQACLGNQRQFLESKHGSQTFGGRNFAQLGGFEVGKSSVLSTPLGPGIPHRQTKWAAQN